MAITIDSSLRSAYNFGLIFPTAFRLLLRILIQVMPTSQGQKSKFQELGPLHHRAMHFDQLETKQNYSDDLPKILCQTLVNYALQDKQDHLGFPSSHRVELRLSIRQQTTCSILGKDHRDGR